MNTSTEFEPHPYKIQFLGECVASGDNLPATTLRSRPVRLLLAYLLLPFDQNGELTTSPISTVDRSVSSEILLKKVWPEGRQEANLRQATAKLRKLFGADLFYRPVRGYIQLNHARLTTDVLEFDACLRQNPPDYARAVRCYHGDFLPEDDLEWANMAREHFKKEYQRALEALIRCAETDGDDEAREKFLARLALNDPANAHRQLALMKLYVAQKNVFAARKIYQRYVRALPSNGLPDLEIRRLADSLNRPLRSSRRSRQGKPPKHDVEPPRWCGFPSHLETMEGRENEIQTISAGFDLTHFVNLIGPSGVGKTLLALSSAVIMKKDYDDGAFVDLVAATTTDQALRKLAHALCAPASRDASEGGLIHSILDVLKEKRFLLILDDCEHLKLLLSARVNELLGECSRLCVLATSQTAWQDVRGAREIAVRPFPVPDRPSQSGASARLARELPYCPSVALFLREAAIVSPGFALTAENARTVARFCHLIGGLPLVIKIAAGLLRDNSLETALQSLQSGEPLLDRQHDDLPARQRTLRAVLETSFRLLPSDIASHFVALAVFQGGWTLEAASEVLEAGAENSLAQLQARLLVGDEPGDGNKSASRLRLPEPIRQFCAEKLASNGQEPTVRTRHLRYYADFAVRLERDRAGNNQDGVLERMESERDNLDSALAWAVESGDSELGLRLAGAAWRFWYVRGVANTSVKRLDALLDLSRGTTNEATSAMHAKVLCAMGNLAYQRRDLARARSLFDDYLAACEAGKDEHGETKDKRGVAIALSSLANVDSLEGKLNSAEKRYSQSLEQFRALNDKAAIARTQDNLAIIACNRQDYAAARESQQESIACFQELGDTHHEAVARNNLVNTELEAQNYFQAVQELRTSKAVCLAATDQHSLVQCLFLHFCLAVKLGLYERTARLLGASDAHRESLGLPLHSAAVAEYHANVEILRRHLGGETFATLAAEGRKMELTEALESVWKAFDSVLAESAFTPHTEL